MQDAAVPCWQSFGTMRNCTFTCVLLRCTTALGDVNEMGGLL